MSGPFHLNNHPEIDTAPELRAYQASFYQTQIGVFRLVCMEHGWIDIITEVLKLRSYLALAATMWWTLGSSFPLVQFPRKVAMRGFCLIWLIWMHSKNLIDWFTTGIVKSGIPLNSPMPRWNDVDLHLFVDSDHANDMTKLQSCTGFLSYWTEHQSLDSLSNGWP